MCYHRVDAFQDVFARVWRSQLIMCASTELDAFQGVFGISHTYFVSLSLFIVISLP